MEENESKIILIEGWTADKVLFVLREKVFHSSVWLQPLESVSGGVWFYLAVVCLCCYIYSRLIKYGSEADNIWAKASKERIGMTQSCLLHTHTHTHTHTKSLCSVNTFLEP